MKAYTLERTIITGGPKLDDVEDSVSSDPNTEGMADTLSQASQRIEVKNQEVIEDVACV